MHQKRRSSVFRSEYEYGSALEWNVQYGFPLSFLDVNYKRTVLAWLGRDPSWDRLYSLDTEDYELLSKQYFNQQIEHYTFKYTFFLDVVFRSSVLLMGFKILRLQELDVREVEKDPKLETIERGRLFLDLALFPILFSIVKKDWAPIINI